MKFKLKLGSFLAAALLFGSQAFATYQPQNPNGQATMANSSPVAIASDQTLPLPSGAATSANQTTGNTSLSTIATNSGNIPAKGQATMTNSTPVAIASNQSAVPGNITQVGSTNIALGSTTGSASVPVVIASDQAAVAANITKIGGTALAFGQQLPSASLPVALAAPNYVTASSFARPADTTAYAAGDLVANNTAGGSVTPMAFAIAPANGVPVYALKALLITQTSGGAGVTITNGTFRLHLFGQSPTSANGDNGAFSETMANWCGTMDGTLLYQGTDYSVAEMVPSFGSAITCKPAGGSSTIYGLLEARAAFTPTNAEVFQVSLTVQ